MKKVLLIARARTAETIRKTEDFAAVIREHMADEAVVENCEISELFFELDRTSMSIYHPSKKFDVKDFDLVVIRHIGSRWIEAHAIARYCDYHAIRYTDTYLDRLLLDNKLSTQFLLWSKGIKEWPRTLFGPTSELIRRLPDLGEKAILKDNEGSKGRLNFVVSSPEDIQDVVEKNPDKQFVLQEFVPNNSDLRVVVFNGEAVLAIRRSSNTTSHLNNTSQGGNAEIVPLAEMNQDVIRACVRAAEITKLQVAGVDVMQDLRNGEYYFLEINNAPQISSGSFKEEKARLYASMIRSMLETNNVPQKAKTVIGRVERVTLPTIGNKSFYARIDTGAKSSSVWASSIIETDTGLKVQFGGFSQKADTYIFPHYDQVVVSSSMGHEQTRYRINLPIILKGRRINATFTLADRSAQVYPMLIGRLTLNGKFIVDVSAGTPLVQRERARSKELQSRTTERHV